MNCTLHRALLGLKFLTAAVRETKPYILLNLGLNRNKISEGRGDSGSCYAVSMRWTKRRYSFAVAVISLAVLTCWTLLITTRTLCDFEDGKKIIATPKNQAIKRFDNEEKILKFQDMLAASGRGGCKFESKRVNCPDIRDLGSTVLRQTQLALVRLLFIFDKICRRHGLKYWMIRGSLLGTVRHAGIIPWDNDLDISMLNEDFERFRIVSHELPDDVFFQNRSSDKEYAKYSRRASGKLKDNAGCYGYCARKGCKHHDGLQLDIFVIDVNNQGLFGGYAFMKGIYLRNVFPLKELQFEGFPVFVPYNYKYFLERKYGDYMVPPPEHERYPTDGMVGIPWMSCTDIKQMPSTEKKSLLAYSVLKTHRNFFWQSLS